MAAEKVPNLTSMSNEQLRQFLLYDDHFDQMSFIQITADYMQKVTETEATSVKDSSQTMTTETQAQNGMTVLTKALNDDVIKEIAEEQAMQASSMPDWLGDVVSGFMFLASIITLNPFIIGMAAVNFAMNFKVNGVSLMTKFEDACGCDSPTSRAEFELGFAAGEAVCCAGASVGGDIAAAKTAAEAGAEAGVEAGANAAKTLGQRALDFVKYFMTYLFQGLALDNFWQDFFKGPCKMSDENSMILGMFAGMVCGIGSSISAASTEDAITTAFRNKLASLSDSTQQLFRYFGAAMNLTGDGFQMASGVLSIEIGEQFKKLADFVRNVMADSMGRLSLAQSLTNGINMMMTQTQQTLGIISDDAVSMNQTFSSYADMFRAAQ